MYRECIVLWPVCRQHRELLETWVRWSCQPKHTWPLKLILILQTPPIWLFRLRKTNPAEKKREKKKGKASANLTQFLSAPVVSVVFSVINSLHSTASSFCWCITASTTFSAKLQRSCPRLKVELQPLNGQHAVTWKTWQTHQISSPGLHCRFHISIPISWRSESRSWGE